MITAPSTIEHAGSRLATTVPAGIGAATTTLVASEGPAFVTAIVYSASSPKSMGSMRSETLTPRSATFETVSVSVSESSPGSGSAFGESVIDAVLTRSAPA